MYALARSATSRQPTMFALMLLLLATGGAIVGLAIAQRHGPLALITLIGAGLVVGGLLIALVRAGVWYLIFHVTFTLAVALGPYLYGRSLKGTEEDPLEWWESLFQRTAPIWPIIGLVGGSVLLGMVRRTPVTRALAWFGGALWVAGIGWATYLYVQHPRAPWAWIPPVAAAALGGLVGWSIRGWRRREAQPPGVAATLGASGEAASGR
jgi:hypothetical protein